MEKEKPEPNYIGAQKEIALLINKPYAEQQQAILEISKKYNCYQTKLNKILQEEIKKSEKTKPDDKEEIKEYTTKELEELGLIDYTETDDEWRKRTAGKWADKFTEEALLKSGILKLVDEIPQYRLDIKCRVLSLLDKQEFDRATELLVKEVERAYYIYTIRSDLKDEMMVYHCGIYIPEGQSYIKEFCRKILGTNYRESIAKNVIDKVILDTLIEPERFYSNNDITQIAVENGILNIFTLELSPFDPKKVFFNKLPVVFDLGKQCPKIDKFLKDILLKEDDINVFYEIAGFALLKEYKFEKGFMFSGDGRNGKGKCIELLKRMVGVDNCSALSLKMLNPENSDISQLFGKFLNIAGDIGNEDLKDTSMFKSLTGRDLISARRKYLTNIHFQNYAKFIFSCNELPMVYDMSKGFWDRWILLEFPFTFVSQKEYEEAKDKTNLKIRDEDIIEKITSREEMSGLLNQALLGLHRLLKNRNFSYSLGTEEVKGRWIRKSNSFMAFCYDYIEEDDESCLSKKELRKIYSSYCRKHKVSSRSDFVIKKVLQDNYGVIDERKETINGVWEWFWIGIKLKKLET